MGGLVLGARSVAVDVAGAPPDAARWATLERPTETAAVRRALVAGRGVLLAGPAGVGKTHLLMEAVAGLAGPPPTLGTISGGLIGPDEQPADVLPALADADRMAELTEAGGCPPLVRVEDGHLLPDRFALRLVRLAHSREIRVAVTLRRLSAARSPWVELWKDGLVDRVDVRDLDAGQARVLLERALGSPVAADTFETLWHRTRGNLFHLRELVTHARQEGTLTTRDGAWAGTVSSPPGPRVLDAVRHDVESLSPAARTALELVALAEPIPVSRVSLHVDGAALEDLELDGVVVVTTEEHGAEHVPTVRTAHPMYGDAVRVLVPVERRRRLFAAVRSDLASPMTRVREPAATVVRSVEWALECGVQETGDRLVEASEAAFRMRRWELVTRFVGAAVERLDPDDLRVPRMLLRRAYAWWMRDEPGRAARDLDDVAARLFTDGGCADTGLAVQLADQWGDLDLHVSGDVAVALARVEEVRRRTAARATAEDVRGLEVVRLTRLGQAGRFEEFLAPALEILAAPAGDRDGALRLVDLAVLGLGQTGRFREACDLALRFAPVATVHPGQIPWVTGGLEVAHALVRLWAGEIDAARHYFAPDRRLEHGTPAYQAIKHVGLGLVAASAGQWSVARLEHRVASARFAVNDPMGLMAYAVAMEARATAATGDAAAARELVDLALTVPMRGSAAVESDLRLHLLDAAAWLGAENLHGEAVRLARWCAARGQHRGELEALHRAVVVAPERTVAPGGGRADLLGRIQALGGAVEGPRAAALVAQAEATVAGDAAFMESAADEVAALGLWLPTARRDAMLTRREREIAALAARGLSSREIAERLTVSVRTVDSHLSRVFAKLGVHSRRDLGPALRG